MGLAAGRLPRLVTSLGSEPDASAFRLIIIAATTTGTPL